MSGRQTLSLLVAAVLGGCAQAASGTSDGGSSDGGTSDGGAAETGHNLVVLATGLSQQSSITAIATDGTNVYFGTSQGVMKIPVGSGGNAPQLSGTASPFTSPEEVIDVALVGSAVYYSGTDSLWKVTTSGGVSTLIESAGAMLAGMAVDGDDIFFAAGSGIAETNFTGTLMAMLTSPSDIEIPQFVVVDSASVYWTNQSDNSIRSIPKLGGTEKTLFKNQSAAGLAIYDGNLYWTTQGGDVVTGAVAGGVTATLVQQQSDPAPIVVDDSGVYWGNQADSNVPNGKDANTILTVGLDGGTPTVLATGQIVPISITVDSTNVYWETEGDTLGSDGTVAQASK